MISTVVDKRVDLAAATISAACVLHCLALPLLGAFAPVFAVWADAEWAHKALVLGAAPLSLTAIITRTNSQGGRRFAVIATLGLVFLLAAAFAEPLHDLERPLTAIGGVLLGGAHIAWWRRHRIGRTPATAAD